MQPATGQKLSHQPGPATSDSGANWNASGSWGAGGDTEDDGGWSSGPPAQGSGWTGAPQSSGSNNNLLPDWQNSRGDASTGWSQKVPTSQSIIVDRNDKEAWPSIGGDHSESASETDNASVKSESVISGSSSFGQGQDNSSSGSSAMQPPNSSSLWSSTSNFNGLESSTWDLGITSSAASSAGWSSSNPSLSRSNQVPNMQGTTSIAGGSDTSNQLMTSSKLGWGSGTPGTLPQVQNSTLGGNRPQSAVQVPQSLASSIGNGNGGLMQPTIPSSGAQPSGPQMSLSQPGPNVTRAISGQGGSAFQTVGSAWGSVGSVVSSADTQSAGKGNSGNNQLQQSGSSEWGTANSSTKPSSDGWPSGNPATPSDWGNPSAGAQWGTQITPSRAGASPQWPGTISSQGAGPSQSPPRSQTTWAQAAGKGLNTNPSNSNTNAAAANKTSKSIDVDLIQSIDNDLISSAVESHDGWGQRPVNQSTGWDTETSPKPKRKMPEKVVNPPQAPPTAAAVNPAAPTTNSNMWNNNNGTAIWENKEPQPTQPQWNNPGDQNSWAGPPKVVPKEGTTNSWGNVPPKEAPPPPSQWGAKTETGSWGPPEGATWRDGSNQKRPSEVDDGTALWGTPSMQKPTNWAPSGPPSSAMAARGPQGSAGWGEAQSSVNNPILGRPAGWGGESNQWNPAVGGPKPKPPSTSSWGEEWNPTDRKVRMGPMGNAGGTSKSLSSWGTDGDMNWNNPPNQPPNSIGTFNWGEKDMIWNTSDNNRDDMMWNDDGSTNWEDTDMGTWTDETVENNSSWSSAAGWKKNPIKGASGKFPGGFQPPTQMRSLLLKQLMEMGFGREEAQHALINNNMNIQSALDELYKSKGANFRRDTDVDVFHSDGAAKPKLPGMEGATDDISDTQSESNPYVPTINSMQNTPFPNAQSQVPNQFIANNMKGPASLTSSSQNINSSIMPPQQRLQDKFKPPLNSMNPPPPGPPMLGGGGPVTPQTQHMAQQQILQQLHLAVKAGLISQQLLNHQLPTQTLMLVQQLLQHQQMLQSLVTTHQLIQQNKMNQNPVIQRHQLERVNMKVNSVKQQILQLRAQIYDAQKMLIKSQPASQQPPPQDTDTISPPDLQNLSISQSQPPQPPQSKLSQWRKGSESSANSTTPTTPSATEPNIDISALNKAVGSKPSLHQSSSSQNLKYGDLGLANLVGDPTWSNVPNTTASASTSWPSTTDTVSTSSGGLDISNKLDPDGKESQANPNSSSATPIQCDNIPEFVPGKPWQGITSKSVEDDPHITPGSFSRSISLSVSTVKDDYLSSLTKTSPSVSESQPWNPKVSQNSKPWSTADSYPTAFSNEVWGVPLQKNRPPPGLNNSKPVGAYSGVNRQHSWAGPSTGLTGNQPGSWDARMSNTSACLILKNLTPQVDGSTLRTLCMQHGPLQWFYLSLPNGQALVKYHTKEEAVKAQKALHTCLLGNTTIIAEFATDREAAMFVEQSAMASQPSHYSQQNNGFSLRQNNREGGWNNSSSNPGYPGGGTGGGGGAGGMWGGLFSGDDHNANALLGNMLGETM